MKENKTRKLICNVTGKVLLAAKLYYDKKATKAGSEDELHRLYVCKGAKDLLKKGYSVQQVQQSLDAENYDCNLTEEDIKYIIGNTTLRINNIGEEQISIIKTDPDVTKFIKNILNNES